MAKPPVLERDLTNAFATLDLPTRKTRSMVPGPYRLRSAATCG